MGLLVDGKWVDQWYDTKASKGHFKRKPSQFRNWITADGSAGPMCVTFTNSPAWPKLLIWRISKPLLWQPRKRKPNTGGAIGAELYPKVGDGIIRRHL